MLPITKEQEQLLDEVRGAALDLSRLTEIAITKRTPEQQAKFNERVEFLDQAFPDFFHIVGKPVFDNIMFLEVGDTEACHYYDNTLHDAATKAPDIPTHALNGAEFDSLFQSIHRAQQTISGLYEEIAGDHKQFSDELKSLESMCRAVLGYAPEKAGAMVDLLTPVDVTRKMNRLGAYKERFRRRLDQLERTYDIVVQLKLVNLGTPTNPTRIREEEPRQSMVRGNSGGRFPKHKPTLGSA